MMEPGRAPTTCEVRRCKVALNFVPVANWLVRTGAWRVRREVEVWK